MACEPWCLAVSSCAELNGAVADECGGCSSVQGSGCHPDASDFPKSTKPSQAAAARQTASTSTNAAVGRSCRKLDVAALGSMDAHARAETFSEPVIVFGLADSWPAYDGNISGLTIALSESRRQHAVEASGRVQEDDVESIQAAETHLYEALATSFVPPHAFMRASKWLVHSVGRATGVRMCKHGFAWLAVLSGAKTWYLAPPRHPKPADPLCTMGGRVEALDGVTHACAQAKGEVMVVPTAWWHATCNAHQATTVAIGGQDECDLNRQCLDAPPPVELEGEQPSPPPPMWRACADETRHLHCHSDSGMRYGLGMPPRLLQPQWRLGYELSFSLTTPSDELNG
jgi:hypothetical protein